MITNGYLIYYKGKISILNNELFEKFKKYLSKNDKMKYYSDLMAISNEMLENTFKKICKILENAYI